ncbi:MAG: NAD(P)/FAD-dependent oxidoreductase [Polyangiaceae bacterium]|nr:NAD(P)/FAD-dependent oxidoreductase [Polyangiaceae bacterium]
MAQTNRYDVIVIGGGHNGLVTAGLLAKRGLRVLVIERRDRVGGAAITETPWGPKYKMTSLSYVVSLLPPTVQRELELHRFGYKVYPQHGYFAPREDGRSLMLPDDPVRKYGEIAKFSKRDADAMAGWDAWLSKLGAVLGPTLTVVPPKLGSKDLVDLFKQAAFGLRFKDLSPGDIGDLTRLMSMSVADLLEDHFESDAVRGALSVSGIIGTWAGPRSPGTAYVMAHHKMGDIGDGQIGAWGFPEGGMGGVTEAMRKAALAFGAEIRTESPVAKILEKAGSAYGVALENGDEIFAKTIVTTVHPKVTFEKLLDPKSLPPEFLTAMRRWKSRSGTVKVNVAVDRLPEFKCRPGFNPEVHGGTIILAESVDDLEGAFQDAAAGRAAQKPFADICIPSVFDKTLAPEGHHVMSMFTQWVPSTFAQEPDSESLVAYAERVLDRVEAVAPGFRSSILHRQVIGPYEMENTYGLVGGNIFHGELSVNQLFHMRPHPLWNDFTTPIRNLIHASSATHGGGGVTGIPALQAVKRIVGSRS